MAKLLTTLQHPDPLINRIQDGIVQVVNPLLKAWYDTFSIPGDCSGSLITQRITLADDWIAATLLNGWSNFGDPFSPPSYRKHCGHTEVRGMISGGTIHTTLPVIVLPASFRSTYSRHFSVASNGAYGQMQIKGWLDAGVEGNVLAQSGDNEWFDMNGCIEAADPSPIPNPIFPLTLANGLKPGKVPSTVLLADAVDVTSLAHVSSSCSWRAYDDTHVQIIDLPGLFATRTYDLTFLVLGG